MLKPSACHSSQTVLQLSFIQKIKENTSSRREGMPTQKTQREEREKERQRVQSHPGEGPPALWLLFLCFIPPPAPALCKLGQPGMLFVLPEVLNLAFGPSFILFLEAFSFLVFSVQFSRSVMSRSLRPPEPQHARPPCPSPNVRVYPNPCPLNR